MRYYGREPDRFDQRDQHFMAAHPALKTAPLLPSVDLRAQLPPSYDQGQLGSCGANSMKRLMAFLYPGFDGSRLEMYWNVREREGTVGQDSGVETRDLFIVAQQIGMAPENDYPYDIATFTDKPSARCQADAASHRISAYSRLSTAHDVLACLSGGMVCIAGFEVPQPFEGVEIESTGIMTMGHTAGTIVGGHDVCCVGYNMNFKSSPFFRASGVDPALVTDHMLLFANSWGPDWGDAGHFWAPLIWMIDVSTGADIWTGRK
jgi:hypothetical protein